MSTPTPPAPRPHIYFPIKKYASRRGETFGQLFLVVVVVLYLNLIIGKSGGTCVEDVETNQLYRIVKMTDFGWNYSVQEWKDGWGKREKMFKFRQNMVETRCP